MTDLRFDFARRARIGLAEAVLCEGKSIEQIARIIATVPAQGEPLLLTRLQPEAFAALPADSRREIDFDTVSRTAIVGRVPAPRPAAVAIVAAGSSDLPVVREAARTLAFHGEGADELMDVGVAGLWRIMEHAERLNAYRAVIVVAGMEGALFSLVGGLVGGAVIAVPTANGYGVAREGAAALTGALASCAPGVVVVNVGNGYGGACAALRVLRASAR